MADTVHCRSYKADGFICGVRVIGEGHRCRTHQNQYNRNVERYGAFLENQCEIVKNGRKCPHAKVEGSLICQEHHDTFTEMRRVWRQRQIEREDIRQQRIQRNLIVDAIINVLRARNPRPTWQNAIRELYQHVVNGEQLREIAQLATVRYTGSQIIIWPPTLVDDYWRWLDNGMVGEEPQAQEYPAPLPPAHHMGPPPVHRLQALARDNQNVHTQEVSEQTNKSTEKLLDEHRKSCSTKRMRSPDWFAAKWLPERYGGWAQVSRIVNDMQHWYATQTCRTENDRLYAKCLDGLYMMIKKVDNDDTRKELYKRAFEECYEAVGMCCEGHISRLCNVMVGFDDSFKPPVAIGELLQNAIAKIAASEKETVEKIAEAQKVFSELNVPEADRVVWLEALEAY